MTFTQTVKGIFEKTPKDAVDNSSNGKGKRFLSKISGAFMLPISVMAIAGLFLGVGAAFESNLTSEAGITFGTWLKNLGDPVFGAMPALFMMAIIISFTDDIGTAVFAGLIAFLVFNALQIPFIHDNDDAIDKATHFNETLADSKAATQKLIDAATPTTSATHANLATLNGELAKLNAISAVPVESHQAWVLIDTGSQDMYEKMYKVVGKNLGFKSMSTSVFGGIVVGFVVSWAYKTFHEVELPSMISFFGGKRFVAFAAIMLMIPLSFLFLLIWPWIGLGLGYFGEYSGKVFGLDSFIFGVVERSLIPFGLHHVFYAPLWWTAAGGDAASAIADFTANHTFVMDGAETLAKFDKVGDQAIWAGLSGLSFNDIHWVDNATDLNGVGTTAISSGFIGSFDSSTMLKAGGSVHSAPVYEFFQDELDMRIGRFMQGKFSFMQMGLPMAGLAMVMAAPKENRKTAAAIIFPASLTSFVTGVTEPIEFTFVFLAPALFWGFHAFMAGISFLLMNLLGAHMGMTFSGGFIDTIVYGIIPMQKGTHFWWAYVIGAGLAPMYYFVFYWWIKRFNLSTPGRGGNTKLFSKADFKAAKSGEVDPQAKAIIEAYGGKANLVKTANCATRLRFDVKDASKVSEDALKAAGAMGVMKVSKTHVQAIFGPKAEVIHGKVKKALDSMGASVASVAGTVPAGTSKKTTAKKTTKKPVKK